MKKINIFIATAMAGLLSVGCNDLDTEPLGDTVTETQKEQVLEDNPEMAEAGVNALQLMTHNVGMIADQYGVRLDNDFGLSGLFLALDSRGIDMIGPDDGFNWFSAPASLQDWGGTYYQNLIYWQYCYNMIKSCNTVAAPIDRNTDNTQLQYYLAQALAFRADCYYMLVNMYQQTYAMNPEAPCVPIITDENLNEAALNGSPRATVAQVWDQVINDCTTAINLFEKAEASGMSRPDKRFANAAVMYGLRARAYLTIQKWNEAAADAQKAIEKATAEGITPYSMSEASVPGFYKISNHNYMWGVENLPSNSYTQGVVNFASMMGAWMPNGYCSVGCTRRISKKLYASIANTDVRKNWWIDGDGNAPRTLPAAYASFVASCAGTGAEFKPYMQVKFAAADNNPGTTSGATDQPIMRIEEMYLIKAEAEAMVNPTTGANTLANFVKAYRDSGYTAPAGSAEEIRDEIWRQRRIELWGEGLAYFDLMRLQKGIDRRGHGFPSSWVFVVDYTDPIMRYQITQDEAETNPLIGDVEEGLNWIAPQPVADTE